MDKSTQTMHAKFSMHLHLYEVGASLDKPLRIQFLFRKPQGCPKSKEVYLSSPNESIEMDENIHTMHANFALGSSRLLNRHDAPRSDIRQVLNRSARPANFDCLSAVLPSQSESD